MIIIKLFNNYKTTIMKLALLFFTIILFTASFNLNAQSYEINKLKYDYHQYVPEIGDPNNPAICGLASFFVPGLGQMVSGETGRGLAFLGGTAAGYVVYGIGVAQFMSSVGNGNTRPKGLGTMFLGLGGVVVINICSIIDAVKVAKVNNMYIQDIRKKTSSLSINVEPYVTQLTINNQEVTPIGLTLKVGF